MRDAVGGLTLPPVWHPVGNPPYSPTVSLAGFFGKNDAGMKVHTTSTTATTNTAV